MRCSRKDVALAGEGKAEKQQYPVPSDQKKPPGEAPITGTPRDSKIGPGGAFLVLFPCSPQSTAGTVGPCAMMTQTRSYPMVRVLSHEIKGWRTVPGGR